MSRTMENFTEQIRRIIKERGITQKQLAQMAGTSQSRICNIFKGNEGMTIESAERIAQALDLEIEINFRELEKI